MDVVKIEKGIPLPTRRLMYDLVYKRLNRLKIGNSILIRCNTDNESLNRIRCRIRYHSKKLGIKWCSDKVKDGLRVWRIT